MRASNSFVDSSVYNLHNWPHFAEKASDKSLGDLRRVYYTTSSMELEYTISIVVSTNIQP